MNSMTGFGRGEAERDGRKLCIELKSVNHRYLDINIRIPRILMFLEDYLRSMIKEKVSRGRLDVFVNFFSTAEEDKHIVADMGLINAYLSVFKEIEGSTGLANDIAISHLLRLNDCIVQEENELNEEELKALLTAAANTALENLMNMRQSEGNNLVQDIAMRLKTILNMNEEISAKEESIVAQIKEKLLKRIGELTEISVDEVRIAQEVVFYADKQNITEEVVRVRNHVAEFDKLLKKNVPAGRQMDFMVQELNREFNTIGSKTSDIEITNMVIAAKTEIEKIREQIQNIE